MSTLLVINSSPMGETSVTRKLTQAFVEKYQQANGNVEVSELDVVSLNLPHLDGEILGAFFTPAEQRNAAQVALVKRSDDLIAQFKEADAIVMGAPMHNFGIPSSLKAYVDHIARAGETFKYSENGPVGLVEDKPVYVISARGGDYSENGYSHLDFVLPYLQQVLAFMGVNTVSLIQANGVAMGEEAVARAIEGATKDIEAALAA
ncbi:FMN-dependent NADH-azoreductase [Candidatus Terasakiella magnetica]|uniref:FMN dependent NADH:quinone oxidoreductase n=1 Tax=Candidatus Terasakiella magnetica TaxID=1867952 RepID=A0A1C3RFK7_9PROT|nr:FMN-dependent NADH-azoreductase [Candidatus Terasakiella magnetica]SCA56077.1 FMN-dependent NADH-azoreductase [Candidatus Terasakiella magnetica]